MVHGQALLPRHACRIKTQESRRVVVQNVALLFGTEEIRRINSADRRLIASGQIISSEPNMICFAQPASTNRRKYL
jgi:hypothetical protein